MAVQIAPGQLCPERACLIHEQQLITIDRRNAGDRIRWFAFGPLREPVAPAQFVQITVPIIHSSPLIESHNSTMAQVFTATGIHSSPGTSPDEDAGKNPL